MVVQVSGPNEVISPCISVCELNEAEVCTGCGRSLDEIAAWSAADDAQRRQIVANARQRQQNFPDFPIKESA